MYESIQEFLARETNLRKIDSSSRARVRVTHSILKNNCHKTVVGTTVISQVLTAKGAKIDKRHFLSCLRRLCTNI